MTFDEWYDGLPDFNWKFWVNHGITREQLETVWEAGFYEGQVSFLDTQDMPNFMDSVNAGNFTDSFYPYSEWEDSNLSEAD